MQANMGMAGEFRCVVKRADGSTKIDTGYQKNLILNQGLDFFGGGKGDDMMAYCVIGSGNSNPSYAQNKLDTTIKGVRGADFSDKYDYDAARDGNLYKVNKVNKYSFSDLNNINISEVGLASTYSNTSDYYLCTRALIKDINGNPTTITVLSGEILEIYYKLWGVFDTTDKTGKFNLLDGVGNQVAYNYVVRPMKVGNIDFRASIGSTPASNSYQTLYSGDNTSITGAPSNTLYSDYVNGSLSNYVTGTYKRVFNLNISINAANGSIRTYGLKNMGFWQIRFGSVADDSPIKKTNTQTLTIPIEISWGRYEGAL